MFTIEDIKNDFENAVIKAQACTTSEEAGELFDKAPRGSVAEDVYWERLKELAKLEAEAKAQA